MHGTDLALADDLTALETSLVELEAPPPGRAQRADTRVQPMRSFVQTRYDLAQLAGAATRLELTVRGGRAYRIDDPAGRRFREAAFLPVQAPTEAAPMELARST